MGYWMRLQKDEDSALLAVSPKLAISVDHLSIYSLRYLVSSFSPSFPPPLWMSRQSPNSHTLMHHIHQSAWLLSCVVWCIKVCELGLCLLIHNGGGKDGEKLDTKYLSEYMDKWSTEIASLGLTASNALSSSFCNRIQYPIGFSSLFAHSLKGGS